MKVKKFVAMKDGHWWCVVNTQTLKKVPAPQTYINYIIRKKDAKILAKALNQKAVRGD